MRDHPREIILAAERLALAPRPKAAALKLNAERALVNATSPNFRVRVHAARSFAGMKAAAPKLNAKRAKVNATSPNFRVRVQAKKSSAGMNL